LSSALSFAGGPPVDEVTPANAGATELIPIIIANITNAVNASFVFIENTRWKYCFKYIDLL